jgi:hypothetical protein
MVSGVGFDFPSSIAVIVFRCTPAQCRKVRTVQASSALAARNGDTIDRSVLVAVIE